jgi:hypothetical protein
LGNLEAPQKFAICVKSHRIGGHQSRQARTKIFALDKCNNMYYLLF